MLRVHDLKVWPEHFDAVLSGSKPYDVRRADRDFQIGDVLLLREWRPESSAEGLGALFDDAPGYTGRAANAEITSLTRGPVKFGDGPVLMPEGVVVLGLGEIEEMAFVLPDLPSLLDEPLRDCCPCVHSPCCTGICTTDGRRYECPANRAVR